MQIIESILTKNPCYTAGRTITVKGLMLHSVGCPQPNAQVFIQNWNRPDYKNACVHGFIDGNTGIIYQTLPWNHRGWHGGGSSNNTHIGVEMCEPSCIKYTQGSSFTCSDKAAAQASVKKTYNAAVELFAMLCKKYNLNPMKDIVSHREGHAIGIATNHGDPEHLWKGVGLNYTMDGFRADVKYTMESEDEKPMTTEERTKFNKLVDAVGTLAEKVDKLEHKMIYAWVDDNMPEWAKPTITKLINKGYLKGDEEGKLNIDDNMLRMLVINDRAGIYGE
ncbi:MAG: peptidoglycan recognition protein family protein [Firmicutes bacterium]|nr:peptidoglycan recognition protein family protein [Bacillota bacterium]